MQNTNTTLSGRVALVTGGSRGIGKATCLALAAQGAAVAVHYHVHEAAANAVAEEIHKMGGKASAIQADLGEQQAPESLIKQIVNQFNRIDILVNNAGEMTRAAVSDLPDEMWNRTLAVNLTAVFRCTRACLPSMIAQKWGRIINISSQAAYTGSANHAHYAASKAGLAGFSYSLTKELGPHGITVNMVAPGRIVTDLIAGSIKDREQEWLKQTPLGRLGQPEEVAAAIVFLASEGASYITGSTIHVNGGLVMS
jgi:3-oxoacyl-[acyl-carrier protein] reductase